jgi:tetratricopeptide (TPR) repeat protein
MWRSIPFALTIALVAAAAGAQTLPVPPKPPVPPVPRALPAPAIPPNVALKLDPLDIDLGDLKSLDFGDLEASARLFALDATSGLAVADPALFDLQDLAIAKGQAITLATSETVEYDRGTSSLDSGRYDRAIESFDKVIAKGGKKAEGALYWKAYALHRLGKRDEAIRTIDELQKKFPSSRWNNDAKALLIDVRQASGQPVSLDKAGDEELKLIALNGLMMRNPEQAIPMVEQLLSSSASPKLKERGLFVLAQSASPRAKTLLADVAKGKGNPDLQLKALDYLGAFGTGPDVPLLVDVYRSTSDVDVKKRVIRSLAMTNRRGIAFNFDIDPVLAVSPVVIGEAMDRARDAMDRARTDLERQRALTEADRAKMQAEVAREKAGAAGRSTGQQGATSLSTTRSAAATEREKAREAKAKEAGDALWQLYQGEPSADLKREILRNMRFADQTDRLMQIAKTESNADLRAAAIQGLMSNRSAKTAETMLAIYQTEKDPAVRRQIVDGFSWSGSAATLVQMARKETDPALRKRIVERLSMMQDKEAVDYMMEILKK